MKKVAFILSLIFTIIYGFSFIPLAWMIPMTITLYKAMKGEKELSIPFKICVILFNNVISGVLLLLDKED